MAADSHGAPVAGVQRLDRIGGADDLADLHVEDRQAIGERARENTPISAQSGRERRAVFDLSQEAGRPGAAALAEPLTDRELMVLEHLPTMSSNAEIAEEMYVSINTVKAHLKSLYRKLEVSSRRGAVHRARELNLFAGSDGVQ